MPSFAKTYKFKNMKKILQVTILFSLLTVGSFAQKQQQILPADQEIPLKYGANRLGKRSDAAMKKFRDNRLGAFIHWGLYAIPGGEWNGKMYNGAVTCPHPCGKRFCKRRSEYIWIHQRCSGRAKSC